MEMEHGGDILGASRFSGVAPEQLLDFSVNVTPLGIPDNIKQAMVESLDKAGVYPDLSKEHLNTAIASRYNLDKECVCCGNGASDLIFRIVFALRPEKALILAPTFVEYASALSCVTDDIESYDINHEDFQVREDILKKIVPGIDMVILCNPNNPTGQLIPKDILIQTAKKCGETGAWLLIDECFLEFVKDGEAYSMAEYLKAFPNTIILKSFTKMFGIAGLRLGYMLCADETICYLADHHGCDWNVNCVAEAAGLEALKSDDYVAEVVAYVEAEREFLTEGLRQLGIDVLSGAANYLLFHVPGEEELYEKLLSYGIMIRTCDNYENLGKDFYRIGVGEHKANQYLLECLQNLIDTGKLDVLTKEMI